METAPTWDSYKPTLVKCLDILKPKRVLEFGIGRSTELFLDTDCIKTLDSVEHNGEWYLKYRNRVSRRFNLIFERNPTLYVFCSGRYRDYDLVFVDGHTREEVLKNIRSLISNGVVILHDAERPKYKESINLYKHVEFEDNGHTAFMTDNSDKFERIMQESYV